MLKPTVSGTGDRCSGKRHLSPGASGAPWGWWGWQGICYSFLIFSSLQAGELRSQTLSHLPEGEMPPLLCFWFPLEGWRQGLNSSTPSLQRDSCSWKALLSPFPHHTHTLPPFTPNTLHLPTPTHTHTHTLEDTDRTKVVVSAPTLARSTPRPWDWDGEAGRYCSCRIGALNKPVLNIPFYMYSTTTLTVFPWWAGLIFTFLLAFRELVS